MDGRAELSWKSTLAGAALVAIGAWPQAAGSAARAPSAAVAEARGLHPVGHGTLRWFGFPIYVASLWSSDGRFDGPRTSGTLALVLAYEHGFTRAELIRITSAEWQRLGLADEASRTRWAAALAGIWSDVAPGQEITTLVVPGAGTEFFDGGHSLGRIADEAFGPAYLAILLDPRSAVGPLRGALIGAPARVQP